MPDPRPTEFRVSCANCSSWARFAFLAAICAAILGSGPLLASGALDMVHPDILTSGGILETKKLGDLAAKYGASMAVHMCESPIASLAAAHMATASENFFALEHDSFDSPWWEDLIIGPVKPMVENGFARVTDAPGLGIEALNEDVIREHGPAKGKNVFISTDEWNDETSLDRLWS